MSSNAFVTRVSFRESNGILWRVTPNIWAPRSLPAPSLTWLALPGVVLPPFLNTEGSLAAVQGPADVGRNPSQGAIQLKRRGFKVHWMIGPSGLATS